VRHEKPVWRRILATRIHMKRRARRQIAFAAAVYSSTYRVRRWPWWHTTRLASRLERWLCTEIDDEQEVRLHHDRTAALWRLHRRCQCMRYLSTCELSPRIELATGARHELFTSRGSTVDCCSPGKPLRPRLCLYFSHVEKQEPSFSHYDVETC